MKFNNSKGCIDKDALMNLELRKKDLYKIDYIIPAFFASPLDKYINREGLFEYHLRRIFVKMDEVILEQGRLVFEGACPVIYEKVIDGRVIDCLHLNRYYRLLNCIVEQWQDIQPPPGLHFNAYTGGISRDLSMSGIRHELFYRLSIIGSECPANNSMKLLREDLRNALIGALWTPPITNRSMNSIGPIINRYENKNDLHPNDFNSIDDLVENLKLVATMESKA